MKVLLIQPNSTKHVNKEFESLQYPLNLGLIAAVLIRADHDVKLIDLNVMDSKKLLDYVMEYSPDVVGVTAMTSTITRAKEIITQIKNYNGHIITVLGGVHASALPVKTMEEIDKLDYLVFGEGEVTIVELLASLKGDISRVDGVVYREGTRIIKNKSRALIKDLDTIPYPPRDLVPMELYTKHHVTRGFSRENYKIIEIITSRGCPNQCIYCAGHINYGNTMRFRSYENVIGEIDACIEKYGINHVSIEDDTFTYKKELVTKLCAYFKKNNITWNCYARVNTVNYYLLKLMADSGCKKISFGVESGSEIILKKIKKHITISQVIEAITSAKKAGIRYIEISVILGSYPDETLADVKKTEDIIYKIMPDFLAVTIMCPFPGTEIYDIMVEKGYMSEKPDWSAFSFIGDSKRYDRLTYLTSDQLVSLQKKLMIKYYRSPKYMLSQVKKIRSFSELKYFMKLGKLFIMNFILGK